ncbi:hypothetical protein EG329_012116 [Mollisiaceae sp. DMI_Dod_QoI]|nr:hypothetical protein EG329_012116 [Helotiales sp. DMI_Dod_QoI]
MPDTMDTNSNRGIGKPRKKKNSKSGCRTCKVRKVKCDEDHPVCYRCTSTGRVCEGYGIWSDWAPFHGHGRRPTEPKDHQVALRPPASIPILALGTSEKEDFEWFKCRTVIKIPGSFVSQFWNTLLFQASLNEPAVLHAVLALSSVHRRSNISADGERQSILNEQEKCTLQHYVKAISHLQPHFLKKDKASFRVALTTCVLFVCLELLRGHFQTAQDHFQNGIKILGEIQMLSNGNDGILRLKPCHESADDWIVEAFSRLHLQVELFRYNYQHSCLILQMAGSDGPVLVFHNINDAWKQIDRLLNNIFHLTNLGHQQALSDFESFQHYPALLEYQQRIRTELVQWLEIYEVFEKGTQGHRSAEEERAYVLPRLYHTMANIMAETCLRPRNESIFDSQTSQFLLIIRQSIAIRTTASAASPTQAQPERVTNMARSIVDLGWIPPLQYVAIKCRVHQVRLHAIRLLESTSHREGIWDSKITARIARKVMEMEERDFYKDADEVEEFSLVSNPRLEDLTLPTLPESYRIREVEVILSGAPLDKVLLFSSQTQEGRDCRILLSEWNVGLQSWIDRGFV